MTTGLVLIVAVLILGGVIATVGDRLGTKVGKARLTLFNLRPRKTATLITILTGGIISASTLGILFAVSDQLRTGVFELERIQDDLKSARDELTQAKTEQNKTEQRLQNARRQQSTAQRRLERINQSLQAAIDKQARTEEQLSTTQSQLQQIQSNFQQAQTLLGSVSQQASALRSEIQQLQTDRQDLVRQRDEVRTQIAQRDQDIAQRDRAIAEREAKLRQLEVQRSSLTQEIDILDRQYQSLEQEYQDLRQGNVAILRNQTLAAGAVRVSDPTAAQQVINQLLQTANLRAAQRLRPDTTDVAEQIIQITNAEATRIIDQIQDGKVYVIRVLSDGNYVVGEPCVLAGEDCVQVNVSAIPNQLVYRQGEVVASTTVDPKTMPEDELKMRINQMITAAQFRARQAGIVPETIQIANRDRLYSFLEQLKKVEQPIEVQAIAAEEAYTAGIRLDLQAVQAGQILFGTQ
ncbi:MAG: DUF3084 domain-containing protein [Drouetiella hepatica Uher 2000/2452]|jgi:uncharacterized protein (DUF3084 family)|uniref:DUF3084 domain-containing protein n=1 Tax=Drouetiella hepatica Uher 2000/2452 TaxID=904376 RepID=A0A951QAQ9_9CYAN|nr:DUF3084 domain-containing protein [Drouetiella hepatica Uher 2000/2452]